MLTLLINTCIMNCTNMVEWCPSVTGWRGALSGGYVLPSSSANWQQISQQWQLLWCWSCTTCCRAAMMNIDRPRTRRLMTSALFFRFVAWFSFNIASAKHAANNE